MFFLSVREMLVSGQAVAVLAATKHVDKKASVVVDLWAREVQVSPTTVGATELKEAIIHAGFDPVPRRGGGRTAHERMQGPQIIPFVRSDDFSTLSEAALTGTTEGLPREAAQSMHFEICLEFTGRSEQ